MIKHIVMWKLKEEYEDNDKIYNSLEIKKRIEALKDKIKVIRDIEIGINFEESNQAYDVVLYSVFDSKEDLDHYQKHEEHVKVGAFIKKVAQSRIVVDYEV